MGEEDPEKLWRRCPFRASFLIDILFLHVFRCVCVYLFWKNPSHPSVSDTMATHSTSPLPSTCFHSSSLGWPYAKKIFKKREENRHDKDRKEKKIYIYITSFGVYLCCAYVYRHGWIRVGYNCYPKWRDRGGGGSPIELYSSPMEIFGVVKGLCVVWMRPCRAGALFRSDSSTSIQLLK